jgi:heme-degrading monooxygenase HmoA
VGGGLLLERLDISQGVDAAFDRVIVRVDRAPRIPGFQGIELLRRTTDSDVEFVTIMAFDSLDAVRMFAGDDYEVAVVPPEARALLARFDARSQHYEVRAAQGGAGSAGEG